MDNNVEYQVKETERLILEEGRISRPLLVRLLQNKHGRSFYLPGPLMIELTVTAKERNISVNKLVVGVLTEWMEKRVEERRRKREEETGSG